MNLCMQADWPKIVRLAPADMARLPPSIITKKNIFGNKQPCLSDGTTPRYFESLNLTCFRLENRQFLLVHSHSTS
jgi:hypothetical protein